MPEGHLPPLVLLKNAARLRTRFLRKLGREQGVEAELGMMLDLAAALRPAPRLSSAREPMVPVLRARLQLLAGDRAAARRSLDEAYAMQPLLKGNPDARAAEAELAQAEPR